MKFNRKTVKAGTFTLIICAVVLAVVIALNLFAAELPASIKSIDTTKEKIFTIGDETKSILSNIKEKVEIFLIVEEGKEDESTAKIEGVIEQYVGENPNISYKRIDPAIHPDFTQKYTEDAPSSNSVIVASGNKSRVIDGSEWNMYETDQGRLTSSQYQQYASMMYAYYGQYPEATELFMGESSLTSAISFVSSENTNKVYLLTGHGEGDLSAGYADIISGANIEKDQLNLLTGTGEIPADCSLIVVNYPTQDISEKEVETLYDYFTNGGNILLSTTFQYTKEDIQPNLISLAEKMGMKYIGKLVFDSDPTRYQSYPYYLVPEIGGDLPEEYRGDSSLTYFMPSSHAIEKAEGTGAEFHSIFVTSENAYLKALDESGYVNTLEKEDGDEEGRFTVAALTTIDSGESEGRFMWFASPAFLEKEADFGGNSALFKKILVKTCEGDVVVTVDPKEISSSSLTLNEFQTNFWAALLTAVLPIAFIVFGLLIWIVRRRKR